MTTEIANLKKPSPWMRFVRFRLRTALGVMLAFAVWIGLEKRNNVIDQRTEAEVRRIAPYAMFHWANPRWLPIEQITFLSRVSSVYIDADADTLRRIPLERFTRLDTVVLEGDSDHSMVLSKRLPKVTIEWVVLEEASEEAP